MDDLRLRIDCVRLPVLPENTTWRDGCDLKELSSFLRRWRDFDWREFEEKINRLPQFIASIDGTEIHFIRIPARTDETVIPVLMVHGWPGSFVEFQEVSEQLATYRDGVGFEVIVPSLPGFGFSQRPSIGEMSIFRAAELFRTLMKTLGYERFLVQGGDFGSGVVSALALALPRERHGRSSQFHSRFLPAGID